MYGTKKLSIKKFSLLQNFTVNKSGWNSFDQKPRKLGDVNGDGKADIVGFAHKNI